jgi:TRAP-type transport system large permease protein
MSFYLGLTLVIFFVGMFMGVPLTFAMLLACITYFLAKSQPMFTLVQQFFAGVDTFTLMAIPFFALAGDLMVQSGTAERMLTFANAIVGRLRGGLAYVTVFSSMLFGGCSGSAISEVAGLGPLQVKMMEKGGYPRPFAAALMTSASIQGPIIPPSIPMVLVGAVTGTSIGGMLLGGAVPGILIGLSMALVIFFQSRRMQPATTRAPSFLEFVAITIASLPFLIMPLIILGGILGGVFTPTEAAAAAVAYGLILVVVNARGRPDWRELFAVCARAAILAAAVLMLSGASNVLGWILATEQVPKRIAIALFEFSRDPDVILMVINVFLLIWGMFMDMLPAIFIIVPILMPLATELGINPVHFGVVVVVNLVLGLLTPPYGTALFTGSMVTGVPLEQIVRNMMPFFLSSLAVLMLITYVPELVLFLPRQFGLDK